MDMINCEACGKLYLQHQLRLRFCNDCHEIYEEKFRFVKEIVMRNPRISIPEIIEQSGISSKLIMDWVRDGRLELT